MQVCKQSFYFEVWQIENTAPNAETVKQRHLYKL